MSDIEHPLPRLRLLISAWVLLDKPTVGLLSLSVVPALLLGDGESKRGGSTSGRHLV